jgi:hypothetical protein
MLVAWRADAPVQPPVEESPLLPLMRMIEQRKPVDICDAVIATAS